MKNAKLSVAPKPEPQKTEARPEKRPEKILAGLSGELSRAAEKAKRLHSYADGLYDVSDLLQEGRHGNDFYGLFTHAIPILAEELEELHEWLVEMSDRAEGKEAQCKSS